MDDMRRDVLEQGLYRRAVEAAVWGMPAVNFEVMRDVLAPEGGGEFLYWSRLVDWKNKTLTPNPDLIYYMAFVDLADGPVVVDIPPGSDEHVLNGSLCNLWQVPLEDVGPFGADEGRGGRYLLLPPGYADEIPDGFIVLQSDTSGVYALLRSVLPHADQETLDAGLAYCEQIGLYPLSEAVNPAATPRRDLHGTIVDTRIPYDIHFWKALDRVVQHEVWLPRDRAFAEMLRGLGIERGKPFAPDAARIEVLERAVQEAHEWLATVYRTEPDFAEGSHWFFPAQRDFIQGQAENFTNGEVYPYTDRAVIYHMAFIGIKRLGIGQFYLVTVRDSNDELLRSDRSYRLRVPGGVPVSQYWSVTAYDGDDHTLIEGNTKYSVASQAPGLTVNDDGSVDVYFGPDVEPGREANNVPTGGAPTFELMFRFYGVGPEVLQKTWTLDDVQPR